jgi:hypothetical protein
LDWVFMWMLCCRYPGTVAKIILLPLWLFVLCSLLDCWKGNLVEKPFSCHNFWSHIIQLNSDMFLKLCSWQQLFVVHYCWLFWVTEMHYYLLQIIRYLYWWLKCIGDLNGHLYLCRKFNTWCDNTWTHLPTLLEWIVIVLKKYKLNYWICTTLARSNSCLVW